MKKLCGLISLDSLLGSLKNAPTNYELIHDQEKPFPGCYGHEDTAWVVYLTNGDDGQWLKDAYVKEGLPFEESDAKK